MPRKQHKYHYIYKTTNLITGRYYYGMHSTSNLEDGYLGSGKRLRYSIRKYGKENHQIEILEFLDSREALAEREKEIVTLDEIAKKDCLNLVEGGSAGGNRYHLFNENHRKKFHAAGGRKVRQIWSKRIKEMLETDIEFQKFFSDKVKRGLKHSKLTWKGRKHSEESKKKMSKSHRGKHSGKRNSQYGTKWITDGIINKKIRKDDVVPINWYYGRS